MTDHNEAIRPNMNDRSEREFMGRMESNHAKLTEFSQVVGSFTQDYQRLYSTYTSYRDMLREVIAERDTLRAEVERLRVDAERYQWLRAAHWSDAPLCCVLEPKVRLTADPTDPAIQARLAEKFGATPEPVGEPVAWRYKIPTHGGGTAWTHTRPQPECLIEAQPLYTHPAPAPQQVPMTCASRDVIMAKRTADGDADEWPEPWAYRRGWRDAETHHGITAQAKGGA